MHGTSNREGLGTYTDGEIREDFRIAGPANSHNPRLYSHNSASIVNDTINGETTKVMRILHAANQVSAGFEMTVDLGKDYDELYLSYDFKFDKEFCSTKGGKLLRNVRLAPGHYPKLLGPQRRFPIPIALQAGRFVDDLSLRPDLQRSISVGGGGLQIQFHLLHQRQLVQHHAAMVMNTFTNGVANADGINEVWVNGRMIFQETNLKLMARRALGDDHE